MRRPIHARSIGKVKNIKLNLLTYLIVYPFYKIIFMALAKGKSSVRCGPLTLHTKTAIHYTELLTGVKFNISSDSFDKNFIIECEGIGLEGN